MFDIPIISAIDAKVKSDKLLKRISVLSSLSILEYKIFFDSRTMVSHSEQEPATAHPEVWGGLSTVQFFRSLIQFHLPGSNIEVLRPS